MAMPRTFSLGQLMLVVTFFCVAAGVAVRFPVLAFTLLAPISFVGPPVAVAMLVARLSSQPRATFWVGMAGALAGPFFMPAIMSVHRVYWQEHVATYVPWIISMVIGVFVFAVAFSIGTAPRSD